MVSAKHIRVRTISVVDAKRVIRSLHYSGKVDPRSCLHLGVFIGDRCGGAMQFGPPIDKRKTLPLVRDTPWSGMLELNRMAFADWLPRNSESRALGWAMRWIRKTYPHVQWILSFSDAAQCGDGAIYRASGFVLTGIRENSSMWKLPSGEVICDLVSRMAGSTPTRRRIGILPGETWNAFARRVGAVSLPGYQLRYLRALDPSVINRLTVPLIPFSRIDELGAGMYKGKSRVRSSEVSGVQPDDGGAAPTRTLHDDHVDPQET
jgi:hypothetical protein